jgi:hypothetical protein
MPVPRVRLVVGGVFRESPAVTLQKRALPESFRSINFL